MLRIAARPLLGLDRMGPSWVRRALWLGLRGWLRLAGELGSRPVMSLVWLWLVGCCLGLGMVRAWVLRVWQGVLGLGMVRVRVLRVRRGVLGLGMVRVSGVSLGLRG